MAESTLSLALDDLRAVVGHFLGYGRGGSGQTLYGETTWTTAQINDIAQCVKAGLRQFYYPPVVPGVSQSNYQWSFLRPTATITLGSGYSRTNCPDDYNGMIGRVTASSSSTSVQSWAIEKTGEGIVREAFAKSPSMTGRPLLIAERPLKGETALSGQRWELYVYPTADMDYTFQVPYSVLPDYLTGSAPYCLGGASHAETIKASCLAIAEQEMDDQMGVNTAKFMERLAASISEDRKLKPASIGYNGDRSVYRGRDGRMYPGVGWAGVTVNGVQPY